MYLEKLIKVACVDYGIIIDYKEHLPVLNTINYKENLEHYVKYYEYLLNQNL